MPMHSVVVAAQALITHMNRVGNPHPRMFLIIILIMSILMHTIDAHGTKRRDLIAGVCYCHQLLL